MRLRSVVDRFERRVRDDASVAVWSAAHVGWVATRNANHPLLRQPLSPEELVRAKAPLERSASVKSGSASGNPSST